MSAPTHFGPARVIVSLLVTVLALTTVFSSIIPGFSPRSLANDLTGEHPRAESNSRANAPTLAELPPVDGSVTFIENMGQFPEEVRFQVRGADRLLWLTDGALWITLLEPGARPGAEMERRLPHAFPVEDAAPESRQGVHLKLSFVDANSRPRLEFFGRLETKVSYFIGNDPDQWRLDVPVWGGVRYMDLYPGLDLEVSSDGGRWSWRLAADAARSASLSAVTLQVEGAEGLALAGDVLRIATAAGEYTLPLDHL
jgi:hypothetical protein